MNLQQLVWFNILVFVTALSVAGQDRPSDVQFKSGGKLNVDLLSESKVGARKFAVVKTRSGGLLKLDKGKTIQRITGSKDELIEYKQKLANAGDTTQTHWDLYEWCRDKTRRTRFKAESLYHLRQIIKIDPSDDKAWRSFKSVEPSKAFMNVDGQWVSEQQHFLSLGYVKIGGHWVPRLQKDANAQKAAKERLEHDRKDRIKKWKRYVLPKESVDNVRAKLFELVDPVSVKYLNGNYLKREDDPAIRALYLEAIGQVATAESQRILVKYLMTDPVQTVREQAMNGLEQLDQFDPDSTASLLTQFLRSSDNDQVNRAARFIGRLKSERVIIPLIDSLKTVHTMATGQEPGRMSTTFNKNGGTGLQMGGNPTVKVERSNEGVLDALEAITDQRHGFDRERWREWYLTQYSTKTNDLLRDADD